MSEYIFVTNIFEYSNIRIYSSHSVLIDSLHHDVVPVLRIDPVVVVDVVLEGAAQDPPLAQKCKK